MSEVAIETGVDELIRFLEDKGKISLKDVAKAINIPEKTLQLWVDFLAEERIVGVEYKFTKPYIFLNVSQEKKPTDQKDNHKTDQSLEYFKNHFFELAKKKKLPEAKIQEFWLKHLSDAIDKKKEFFLREAVNRELENTRELFENYKKKLLAQ